jgi:hypothetical protein
MNFDSVARRAWELQSPLLVSVINGYDIVVYPIANNVMAWHFDVNHLCDVFPWLVTKDQWLGFFTYYIIVDEFLPESVEAKTSNTCTCDFHSVILRTGTYSI